MGQRVMDVLIAGVLAFVLAPLMAAVALAVKLSSPGPALFRQRRVGMDGRLFTLCKFRTMRQAEGGPSFTPGSTDRITRTGRLLRQWKLDELPQLFNVLRGDMSLVGPRPEVPEYVLHYTPEQRQVLKGRPGITGVSQLAFRDEERLLAGCDDPKSYYIETIMQRKLELDLNYLRNRSVGSDVGVLLRTVRAVLGRGHR